ncbi:MAG TPA: hypothetical protein DCQ58_04170 [Saprospirales bacterium]|nr:hypothetical protein [Saprospirales bacterium]HAX71568.1 hypothetical protein [Anaerolineae bacterium]
MKDHFPQQYAFLLRIWRSNSEWRISLENPITGERNGFSKFETFVKFLENHMDHPVQNEEENHPSSTNSNS